LEEKCEPESGDIKGAHLTARTLTSQLGEADIHRRLWYRNHYGVRESIRATIAWSHFDPKTMTDVECREQFLGCDENKECGRKDSVVEPSSAKGTMISVDCSGSYLEYDRMPSKPTWRVKMYRKRVAPGEGMDIEGSLCGGRHPISSPHPTRFVVAVPKEAMEP